MDIKKYEKMLDSACDQVIDLTFQIEDIDGQKKVVSEYQADIQTIKNLKKEEAKNIEKAAKPLAQTVNDKMERLKEKEQNVLTKMEFSIMQCFIDDVNDDMADMKEAEENQSVYKSSIKELEESKDAFLVLEDTTLDKKNSLKLFFFSTIGMMVTALVFVLVVGKMYNVKLWLPLLGILVLLAGLLGFLFVRYRNCDDEIEMGKKRLKYKEDLLQKVKQKHHNNTQDLNYLYLKYGVENQRDLFYLLQKYNEFCKDLTIKSEELNDLLKASKLKKNWSGQILALSDRDLLEQLKEHLLKCESKLKDHIVSNEKAIKKSFHTIKEILGQCPELKGNVDNALDTFDIKL